MDALHEELQINILHRLPVMSIGVCMCVNKNWLSLIKTPSFISSRSKIKNINKQYLMFWSSRGQFELRLGNKRFDLYKTLTLPHVFAPGFYDFGLRVCDGMLCLPINRDGSFMLWNPIIQKSLLLPKATLPHHHNQKLHVGFWFDSLANDHKLIRILCPKSRIESPIQVEIFSLNSHSWKTISMPLPILNITSDLPICNDALHWTAYCDHNYEFQSILGFDVNAEEFRKIEMPNVFRRKYIDFKLSIYKETSIAICSDYNSDPEGGIWVMKEYGNVESWIKIWQYHPINSGYVPHILGFLNNGKQLWEKWVATNLDGKTCKMFFSIDSKNGENEELAVVPNAYSAFDSTVKYFEDSLVLLDNANATTL